VALEDIDFRHSRGLDRKHGDLHSHAMSPAPTAAPSGSSCTGQLFTSVHNSFLVEYDIVSIPDRCDPYPPTAYWAEPSVSDAVSQRRRVRFSPKEREPRRYLPRRIQ
jgi:hypothetical protein